ncbi:dTDP-4-amino-4,6-dideoxygalactose transaminase [Photorhabdus asymbiotica]|nr:dTDP-4-amino-4,6-dideoxygalactose transaminase [Photorhabdus asymbiotica]
MVHSLKASLIGYTGDKMIPFNRPPVVGTELDYMKQAIESGKLCGDGGFTKRCEEWMEQHFNCPKVLLTPSCTASLEMAAILLNIQPGDEVIMPSFTFVSTSNAFVLRGATIVFVDIRPDTMNIDETKIEAAITDRTRVIVPVHYAGVACEMDEIMALAEKYNLFVVEDAAQGVMSAYKGRALGTIGHIGCYSFHETKNYSSGGEGGAALINDESLIPRAEIIREKGTNRSQFFRGQVDKYTWRDIGSSYLMSDLQAAYLWAQLEEAIKINERRLALWNTYYQALKPLADAGRLTLPVIPEGLKHNAHMFYIKLKDVEERSAFNNYMKDAGVLTVFHYVSLHTSPGGEKFGRLHGEDHFTTSESDRLVRLPMFYNMTDAEQQIVIKHIREYFA